MHSIIIFASGTGTNAKAVIDYFKETNIARVTLVVCNKPFAGVIDIAKREKIPYLLVDKNTISETLLIEQMGAYNPSLIILAGFLWLIPTSILTAFPSKTINIHPSLLPNYGGKGMHGHKVHEAVLNDKATETGMTIHIVDEQYDKGKILLQARCAVYENDTIGTIAARVLKLEHYYLPRLIEQILLNPYHSS